jgi:signal transduction histidine kinase
MLENAIKYGDGKEIRITLREEEDCKLLSVENTGCSLKEEELPNLFDSFYRGSNSQGVKGSGLGLYICRELMKKMDGEVFAEIRNGNFLVTAVIQKA